ncbi:hypothetical protein niasHT_020597 [Heterodera trifolii]|uniref:Uncharacterized protein n=1 Tax=Heterodera trifolii TaxID=157864 RepID=A0ABD2K5Y1_9BILA
MGKRLMVGDDGRGKTSSKNDDWQGLGGAVSNVGHIAKHLGVRHFRLLARIMWRATGDEFNFLYNLCMLQPIVAMSAFSDSALQQQIMPTPEGQILGNRWLMGRGKENCGKND